jgi:lipopolysaccharide transport system ATP-binding protein
MAPTITVDNVSKCYRIQHDAHVCGYRTLRETLSNFVGARLRRWHRSSKPSTSEDFWALRDVAFEVAPGEALGIIGRNGAGKSTLLKILSRITRPTGGAVTLRGRVGSLLEVGTGFHPELTGRENIYLSGSILGMSRKEIARRFDEIVAFAEVDRFLDTPVKRYSSGMYVRLAFAVAAHLEPEILIVDEVLAVGDAQFQKKCLGKMEEGAKQGRTVLFVSHTMSTILRLCSSALLLVDGRVQYRGTPQEVVQRYLRLGIKEQPASCDLSDRPRQLSPRGQAVCRRCRLLQVGAGSAWTLDYGMAFELEVVVDVKERLPCLELALALCTYTGFEVASPVSADAMPPQSLQPGHYSFTLRLPGLRLAPGRYYVGMGLRSHRGLEDYMPDAVHFEVLPTDASAQASLHTRLGAVVADPVCEIARLSADPLTI